MKSSPVIIYRITPVLCTVALIFMLIAAIMPQKTAGAADQGNDPFIRQLWHVSVPGYIGKIAMSNGGMLYVISTEDHQSGTLYALTKEGEVKWQRYLPVSSRTPVLDDMKQRVYVTDGTLRALDGATGEQLWSFSPKGDTVTGMPTVHDDIVYAISNLTGTVYAIDTNGSLLWKDQIANGGHLSPVAVSEDGTMAVLHTYPDMIVDKSEPLARQISSEDGSVSAYMDKSTLFAFDKDGFPLWQTELKGAIARTEAPIVFDGGYAIDGDVFYIVDHNGKVLYKPQAGEWSSPGQAALIDNILYYPSNNNFHLFDTKGRLLKSIHTGGVAGNAVMDREGRIVFWQEFGRIVMINKNETWRILFAPLSGYPSGSLLLDTDGVYYTTYTSGSTGHMIALKDTSVQMQANKSITVWLDGMPLSLKTEPVAARGRIYLPMRELFTALGAKVDYDEQRRTITAVKGNTTIKLTIGSNTATVNGKAIILDAPGKVLNGRMMVPLRFVSESFGYNTGWDQDDKKVTITS
ncbi:stalk domain-containing protein [Paenibacillus montanisoli]|uniref:Copper amine oxidase-like N-terminal domain-containing protein n=1 Tax=Paenibacillus montanisoli TaxID=2081970 RepID=A0A328U9T0_9BACL|nr:stalk domain-containing protein [Paenibacillus montanisoli]RAP78101.1 hypothetical protein DL346_06575 [Paenibacillus montanisoli]